VAEHEVQRSLAALGGPDGLQRLLSMLTTQLRGLQRTVSHVALTESEALAVRVRASWPVVHSCMRVVCETETRRGGTQAARDLQSVEWAAGAVAEADVLKQVASSLRERGEATLRENTRCTQTEGDTDVERELAALKAELRSAAAHRQADAAKVHHLEASLIASSAARETHEGMVAGAVSAADAVDEGEQELVSCIPWPFRALLVSPEARKLLLQERFAADIRHLPAVKLNGVIMRLLESKVVDDNKARTLGVRPLRLSDSPKLHDNKTSTHCSRGVLLDCRASRENLFCAVLPCGVTIRPV